MNRDMRQALVQLAMRAATDSEWGYESDDALAELRRLDADYDWEPELLQAELEAGHRRMGPHPYRPLDQLLTNEALKILSNQIALVQRVYRDPGIGTTVTVRVPDRFTQRAERLREACDL
jgi:hypothetical protein